MNNVKIMAMNIITTHWYRVQYITKNNKMYARYSPPFWGYRVKVSLGNDFGCFTYRFVEFTHWVEISLVPIIAANGCCTFKVIYL